MPKIETKTDIKKNQVALLKFKQDEEQSEVNMKKLYEELKKESGNASSDRKGGIESEEFKQDPQRLRNWTYFGKD